MSKPFLVAWRNIAEGTTVALGGTPYVVTKLKLKGKRVTVTVEGRGGTFTRALKAKDEVEVARAPKPPKSSKPAEVTGGPPHDDNGAQRRWAEPGDAELVRPPAKASGGTWHDPAGKAERRLAKTLGAILVGEATDPDAGYYVPPVDPSTIAAHLYLFHGVTLEVPDWATLSAMHEDEHLHARGLDGAPVRPLHVNHWHTKERPST